MNKKLKLKENIIGIITMFILVLISMFKMFVSIIILYQMSIYFGGKIPSNVLIMAGMGSILWVFWDYKFLFNQNIIGYEKDTK